MNEQSNVTDTQPGRQSRSICLRLFRWLPTLLLVAGTTGCGSFVAHKMAQAPNTYPSWFAPKARVALAFSDKFLTNFPSRFVNIGPPSAQMCYRIVDPADYHEETSSTNWLEHGHRQFKFTFKATVPGETNVWTASPRGTVVLVHGYGLAQFAMSPWALRLAQDGWRCVLVDLRGHGKSSGKHIYYGAHEAHDLSQLLDALSQDGELLTPLAAVGDSYGAGLVLRWKAVEPRLGSIVAIAPYSVLSNSVINICRQYAHWIPQGLIKSGLRKLPGVLHVEPGELDTATVMARSPVAALFVAGTGDKIAPLADVKRLFNEAAAKSKLVVVTNAAHEALPYYFDDLVPPVLKWLDGGSDVGSTSGKADGEDGDR